MIRHYFRAALGDLFRSPIQSLIAIGGLAIGLAAAIMAGIVAVNQLSYDDFVPGHQQLYYPVIRTTGPNIDVDLSVTPHDLGTLLKTSLPGVTDFTRIAPGEAVIRHGETEIRQDFLWADPNFFRLLPMPALYGDPTVALARPDGLVLTRGTALKYFGRADAVGQTLEMDRAHVMTVRAVIADLPQNASTLDNPGLFASSVAAFSEMSRDASRPGMTPDGGIFITVRTIVQVAPGTSITELNLLGSAVMGPFNPKDNLYKHSLYFAPLAQFHLSPRLNPGVADRLWVMVATALVILALAIVNFVNLAVARSALRGREVAVRKSAGAGRAILMAQFLGEAVLQVFCGLCVAVALVELSLPAVNAFLDSGAVFDYWRDPALLAVMLAGTLAVGLLAGAYPAFVLSSFRPAPVLKGLMRGSVVGERVRQILVAAQFAALIVLLAGAVVMFEQNDYATSHALGLDTEQALMIRMPQCDEAFRARIAALPGVRGAACSGLSVLPEMGMDQLAVPRGGLPVDLSFISVGPGFFELYGLKPLAGRFFQPGKNDAVPDNPDIHQRVRYVINQTAAKRLGYATPEAAIGQTLMFENTRKALAAPPPRPGVPRPSDPLAGTIIGVVKDASFAPGHIGGDKRIGPMAYSVGVPITNLTAQPGLVHVRLSGQAVPQTLAAIDRAWKDSGGQGPIDRKFVAAYERDLEITVLRQGQAFAVFAGIAMFLACLGLVGVSLSSAVRRTKEIGIRKAMGAGDGDILRQLLWQFAKPVLWANVIAWPLGFWAMNYWLSGFPYHVALDLWLFPAASLAALAIAALAVSGHAASVARQKPVLALRYE